MTLLYLITSDTAITFAALAQMLRGMKDRFRPCAIEDDPDTLVMAVGVLQKAFRKENRDLCPAAASPFARKLWKFGLTRIQARIRSDVVAFVVWDEKLEAFLDREGVAAPKEVTPAVCEISQTEKQGTESEGNKGQEKEKEGTVAHQNDIEMHQNAPQETYDQKMDRVLGYTAPETRDLDGYIKIGPYLPDPKTAEAQMCISTRVRPDTAVQIERLNALWNTTKYTTVRRILEMIDLDALFNHALQEKIDALEKMKKAVEEEI